MSQICYKIRKICREDIDKLFQMQSKLDSESEFMLFEEGERTFNQNKRNYYINNYIEGEDLVLIVEYKEQIIGFLSASRGNVKRNHHVVYIVIGILEKYHGIGIGKELFKELDKWSISNNVVRQELTVMVHNERAIKLYEKMNFSIEGKKRDSLKIGEKYIDEYFMAKVIKHSTLQKI